MAAWLSRWLHQRGAVPRMSETERIALAAGDVWIDGDLFSGRPDLRRLLDEPYPELTRQEAAYLDGPVEEVCARVDDWRLWQERELPAEVWELLKRHGFFGLNVPVDYGGLGFSALAQSAVFGKLTSRSLALAAVVMIPNSVGPAELLLEYGTAEQRRRWLPRLASGDEIPCFALTEPEAGSDAASLVSEGTVFRGGADELLLRLNWSKRYITLAPVATLLGLAVRLRDPDELLGRGPEPGITCVLVAADEPGVEIGRRHDPLGVPLPNGPTLGRDVVVPLDAVIGGAAGAGQGWKMLMETLAAGRAVSLPGQAAGGIKAVARGAGAYAALRRQFGLPIGRFEGVQEPLARLAGRAYAAEAVRVFTCGAVDAGHRPAVISALTKLSLTEAARASVQDGMDVLAGSGICLGPRNLLGRGWIAAPIGITVEGANILGRTLIVFGQGLTRCHPRLAAVMRALESGRTGSILAAGGGLLWGAGRSLARAAWLSLTRARLRPGPGPLGAYARRVAWGSALLRALSDLALLRLGGTLKRHGRLSGRYTDALDGLYTAVAALRRFEAEGRLGEDLALARWVLEESLARAQTAFEGILGNFPGGVLGRLLRGPGRWLLRASPLGKAPSDALGAEVATALLEPGERRDRLTSGLYVGAGTAAELERALGLAVETAPLLGGLRAAARRGELPGGGPAGWISEATRRGLLTPEESALLREAESARRRALEVDSFTRADYLGRAQPEEALEVELATEVHEGPATTRV